MIFPWYPIEVFSVVFAFLFLLLTRVKKLTILERHRVMVNIGSILRTLENLLLSTVTWQLTQVMWSFFFIYYSFPSLNSFLHSLPPSFLPYSFPSLPPSVQAPPTLRPGPFFPPSRPLPPSLPPFLCQFHWLLICSCNVSCVIPRDCHIVIPWCQ